MALPFIPDPVVACHECGQHHRYQPIAFMQVARCSRCHGVLYRNRPHMLDASLALTLTGLLLFFMTNALPLLELRAQGLSQEITLWKAAATFWQQNYQLLSVLLLANLIIFPLFELLALLWVLLTIRWGQQSNEPARFLFRWMQKLKPWGMLEVFMLGVLVALVKLGDLATLVIGPAFWSFSFLIISMAAATAVLDPFVIWSCLDPATPDRGGRQVKAMRAGREHG